MSRTIKLNDKEYTMPEIDFNAICELSELGVDVMNPETLSKHPIPTARAVVAWITGENLTTAGNLIQTHLIAGGDIAHVLTGFIGGIEDSGFFKSLPRRKVEDEEEPKEETIPKKTVAKKTK